MAKEYSHENFVENYNFVLQQFHNDFEQLRNLYENVEKDPATYYSYYEDIKKLIKANIDNKPCQTSKGVAKISDKDIKARFIIATFLAKEEP